MAEIHHRDWLLEVLHEGDEVVGRAQAPDGEIEFSVRGKSTHEVLQRLREFVDEDADEVAVS